MTGWQGTSEIPRGGRGSARAAFKEVDEILALPDCAGRDVRYTIDHGLPVSRAAAEGWASESESGRVPSSSFRSQSHEA